MSGWVIGKKGFIDHWTPKTFQPIHKASGQSAQHDSKALLLKVPLIYAIECGAIELVKLEVSMLLTMIHSVERWVLCPLKEKSNHQYYPATNPAIHNSGLPAGYTGEVVTQILWEQPTTFLLDTRFTTWF